MQLVCLYRARCFTPTTATVWVQEHARQGELTRNASGPDCAATSSAAVAEPVGTAARERGFPGEEWDSCARALAAAVELAADFFLPCPILPNFSPGKPQALSGYRLIHFILKLGYFPAIVLRSFLHRKILKTLRYLVCRPPMLLCHAVIPSNLC